MTDSQKNASKGYEDLQGHIPSLKTPEIEVWEFQFPGSDTEITVNIPEFTCICPKTGLPDFATIVIKYTPNAHCLELKSLKEYILFYREVGIFSRTSCKQDVRRLRSQLPAPVHEDRRHF